MRGEDGDPEPIDLEPVDLEPGGVDTRVDRERGTGRRSGWVWGGIVSVGLAAWAVIALTTGNDHPKRASTPPTTAAVPLVRIDRVTVASTNLHDGMAKLGVERFAAVIDDHLYVFASTAADPTRVRLRGGDVVIQDQNGSSLLASTFEQTLVSTRPIATRTLSPRDTVIRSAAPAQWWLLRDDGSIRTAQNAALQKVPTGLRVVAAVRGGFVALDRRLGWVLWSGTATKSIGAEDQFLVAGPRALVFMRECGYSGCTIDVRRPTGERVFSFRLAQVPTFAVFSPDGKRLAIGSTQGQVFIVDPAIGALFGPTQSLARPTQTLTFTWTADSRALLIVQENRIEVRRASDGRVAGAIDGTEGVQQLVALP
jgi:hypothetical protein